jgi:Histidine kinase
MHPTHLAHRPPNRRGTAIAPKIETGVATNTLRFQCPNTGREVDSGVSTHCGARLISIRVRCPICEDLHECRVADGSLGALLSADDESNDTQSNKAPVVLQVFPGPSGEIIELREQLLDELNHRLKNNLQVLYGLLKVAWRKNGQLGCSRGAVRYVPTYRRDGECATGLLLCPEFNGCQRGKNSSKRSVPIPEPSLAKTYRSSMARP